MGTPIFTTIITHDYMHFALTLNDSIIKQNDNAILYILVSNEDSVTQIMPSNIRLVFLSNLLNVPFAKEIIEKYKKQNDVLRWSLKSILLHYILTEQKHEKVIFLDPDIYVVGDYDFLFNELNNHSILLTPHWRNNTPNMMNHTTLYNHAIFNHGLFNAGFLGVNKDALDFLIWWAQACLSVCEKNKLTGHHDDQRYLDFAPIYFDAKIIQHKGCNLAEWNFSTHKITTNGEDVVINGIYSPVFIHFTLFYYSHITSMSTCCYLTKHKEHPLHKYFLEYRNNILKYNKEFDLIKIHESIIDKAENNVETSTKKEGHLSVYLKKLNQKLRLKRRIKMFLKG